MTVEKPKPEQLLRPITTGTNSSMSQSQFLAITCTSLEAREKSRIHGAIGFGFASHWLKNWCESFKPIIKRSNRNHVITFDSHLKTALFNAIALAKCVLTILELNWNQHFSKTQDDKIQHLSSCAHVIHITTKKVISC